MNFEKYIKLLEKYSDDQSFITEVKESYKFVQDKYISNENGLRKIRRERHLSQEDVIDMLYEDKYILSETTISNLERGKNIEQDSLERIAKVLNVTAEAIL